MDPQKSWQILKDPICNKFLAIPIKSNELQAFIKCKYVTLTSDTNPSQKFHFFYSSSVEFNSISLEDFEILMQEIELNKYFEGNLLNLSFCNA